MPILLLHKYKAIGLISAFFFVSIVVAQTSQKLPYLYQEKLQKANEYYSILNYGRAIELYKEVIEKAGEDTAILCKMANSFRLLNDAKDAEEFYRRAIINNESTISPVYKLQFAQVLTMNNKYDEAVYWFKDYYKTSNSDTRALEAIKSIENVSTLFYDTLFYVARPVSINSAYTEFSPTYYKDGLLFLSDRDNAKSGLLSWYYSEIDKSGSFSKPLKHTNGIKADYNEAPLSFFNNGNKMIFSKNYTTEKISKKKINEIPLQLFYAELGPDKKWQNIQLLPFEVNNYSYSQPSVTEDGTWLFFSSDMPGGFGGTDLYMSKFENGKWAQPKNLGKRINTAGEEMFPFISHDSILYFSSNGHGGLGGLDNFKVNLNDSSELKNLGVPMNSPNDDFGIIMANDGLSGYFASNRSNETLSDDIFEFKLIRITVTIKIIDENTALPVSYAVIYSADSLSEKQLGTTDKDGNCTLVIPVSKTFKILIKKDNYESKTYSIESLGKPQSVLAVVHLKSDTVRKEEQKIVLTDENNLALDDADAVYKIQIFASRIPATSKELKHKYKGDLPVNNYYEDNWYKYAIGEYHSYSEAKQVMNSCNVYDSFIIAYIHNKKVHITIAKAATKETNVKSPITREKRRK